MSNTYKIKNSKGTLLKELAENKRYVLTEDVVLSGRGTENYGLDRNRNLFRILENFAGSPAPENPINGQMWWDPQRQALRVYSDTGSPNWRLAAPLGSGVGFAVIPGDGLKQTGSPLDVDDVGMNKRYQQYEPFGSPLTLTLAVKSGGHAIVVAADSVRVEETQIFHDETSGFVANEHIDHTSVTLSGNGFSAIGDISTSRTLNIGAGSDITVNANDVAVGSTVVSRDLFQRR